MVSPIDVRFDRAVSGFNSARVRKVVAVALKKEKAGMGRIGVRITDDRTIRRINKKFLKHDWATDVISFGFDEPGIRGDVVVSAETARRLAKELKIPFAEELSRYLIHGTLHLLGYDDKRPVLRKAMFRRQEAILKGLK